MREKTRKMTKTALVKVVTVPQLWYCNVCGGRIEAGKMCAKQGKKVICSECIMKGGNQL